jgi:hypothetical protein
MLPTKLDSLGKGVSEEKMFSEISQSEPRMICGGHVCFDPETNMATTGKSCF